MGPELALTILAGCGTPDSGEDKPVEDTGVVYERVAAPHTSDGVLDELMMAKLVGLGYGDGSGMEAFSAIRAGDASTPQVLIGAFFGEACLDDCAGVAYVEAIPDSGVWYVGSTVARVVGDTHEYFGASVAYGGDVNGDGEADLVAGAPGYSSSEDGGFEGATLLFSGPIDATTSRADPTAFIVGAYSESESDSTISGIRVDFAGDTDGDGFDDLLVGADGNDEAAFLLRGPVVGNLELLVDADATFDAEEDSVVWGMAGVGDMNADGLDDIGLCAPGADRALLVFLGPVSGTITTADADGWAADGPRSLRTIRPAGDTNNDGYADVVFSDYLSDDAADGGGATFILEGPGEGEHNLSDLAALLGDEALAGAGVAIDAAGDMDGDGNGDVVIGAYTSGYVPYDSTTSDGAVYVTFGPFFGTTLLSDADIVIPGGDGDWFGRSVAGIGDVDGDGLDDIAASGSHDDDGAEDAGAVWILPAAKLLR